MELDYLTDGGPWWFGVWSKTPLGECACKRGAVRTTERDVAVARRGDCTSPGKHPVVWRMDDGLHGFPHGWRDAVSWQEWGAGLGRDVEVLGGRAAVAIPDDVWVLDVDDDLGWRGLTRLFKAGALGFDSVDAVSRTVRGWHVWIRPEQGGWTTGSAQWAVNTALKTLDAPLGLEVKSHGGYVVWPDGIERHWVDRQVFARAVAWRSQVSNGRYSLWARREQADVAALGSGMAPPVGALPEDGVEQQHQDWSDDQRQQWRDICRGGLQQALGRLAKAQPGQRNNRLNQVAWFAGRQSVAAGDGYDEVSELLVRAGMTAGLDVRECRATVRSALRGLESESHHG